MKKIATIATIAALSSTSFAMAGSPVAVAPVEVIVDEPAGMSSAAIAVVAGLGALLLATALDDDDTAAATTTGN